VKRIRPWWGDGVVRPVGRADAILAPKRGIESEILRKEVIQPQVPLRLPCYDLVPITGFTFGACPCGQQRLRVPPALVA
jgi:hypothetical protein